MQLKKFRRSGACSKLVRSLLLSLFIVGTAVADDPPTVYICETCASEPSFASIAQQLVMYEAPIGQEGHFPVYVINLHIQQIRFFDVYREYTIIDPEDPGGLPVLTARPVPGNGDATVITAMQSAMGAVQALAQEMAAGVHIGDIGNLGDTIESAIDLVGPQGTVASLRRNMLANELNDHFVNKWRFAILTALTDLAKTFAQRFVGMSAEVRGRTIIIEFEDGTIINVDVEQVLDGPTPRIVFTVQAHTVRGPGLSAVPQFGGEFNGFQFTGDSNVAQRLMLLAQLYGVPVTDGTGGSGGGIPTECKMSGDRWVCSPVEQS